MIKLIDTHHHILPSFYRDALIKAGIPKQYNISLPEWSVDTSRKLMDRLNIQSAITSISTPATCIGDVKISSQLARQCNEYAAELSNKYPKIFGGFATLPMPHIDESIEEIIYALDTLKLKGVTLLSNYQGTLLGNRTFAEIFKELNKRHTAVFIHPTIPCPCGTEINFLPASMYEFICDSTRTVIQMLFNGIFEKYDRIKFIIPHAGGTIPYIAGRISLYETLMPSLKENIPKGAEYYLKNLYYDTAMSTSANTLDCLRNFASISNILIGTDYPFVSEDGVNKQIKSFFDYPHFTEEEKILICHKNMENLFQF